MVVLPKNFSVTKINLSGLGLTEIPKEVFNYKNLRKLFLHNNAITKIPTEIKQLKLLNTLDLSNNRLTTLYASMFELKNLEVLIFNNNKIKSIPQQIKKLKKLRILGIANNRLIDLNSSFESLKELRELNLSGNIFHEFPMQVIQLDKLDKLWIKQKGLYVMDINNLALFIPINKVYRLEKENNQIEKSEVNKETKQGIVSNTVNEEPPKLEKSQISKLEKAHTENTITQKKKKIFISYSHQDKEWLTKVKKHIKVLDLYNVDSDFELWDDERIKDGSDWKKEIEEALFESTAAILLISTDFLGSDFIKNNELQPLLKKAEEEGTLILPLILSPCRFIKISSLSKFQAVNNPKNQILTELNKHDQEVILEKLTDDVENHINSKN